MGNAQEGVIKFELDFEQVDIITLDMVGDLEPWRQTLFKVKLIGQDPKFYEGYSYGNLSRRLNADSKEFIITGSQTSHLAHLTTADYALVIDSFVEKNKLYARGLTRPSSEALTHAAFYQASSEIQYVFHVHSASIWMNTEALNIPVTVASIAYGTPEMALEIQRMFDTGQLASGNIVAMGGHEHGVISFGATADEAGSVLLNAINQIS